VTPAALATAAASLAVLALIFIPLEWAIPAWTDQRRWRRGLATDLAFFAGQHLLFAGIAVVWLTWLADLVVADGGLGGAQQRIAAWPLWLQAVVALWAGDLCMYWGHRLQHAWDPLWRFHAVHHTAERLDFMAAHREHPLDGLYTQALMNLPAIAMGLPVEHVMGLVAFRAMWAIFIHANAGVRLGWLGDLLGSPQLHHWHHARDRDAGNYANLAPWLDRLFGTYHRPATTVAAVGLREAHPRTYLALLLWPFRRRPTSRDVAYSNDCAAEGHGPSWDRGGTDSTRGRVVGAPGGLRHGG
jgi:sterol desaturase/sphingolipid hydroxylase (fatty acid hydroxylase superfamily)